MSKPIVDTTPLPHRGGRMWVFFKLIADNGIDEYCAYPTID